MKAPTRRGLLGGVAVLAAAPAVVGQDVQIAHPDADLLAACAAHDRLERAYLDVGFDYEEGSVEQVAAVVERERLADLQEPVADRICELRAVTREGMAARARSLALWDAELMNDEKPNTNDRLMAAIVRDLLAS